MERYSTVPMFSLKAVRERGVRYPSKHCGKPEEASDILYAYLANKDCEHVAVLLVDGAKAFLGMALVTIGTIDGVKLLGRDVFKHALVHRAHAIVLGHNHPSGNPKPTEDDIAFTHKIRQLGSALGCPLLDHIIIAGAGPVPDRKNYFSFHEHGL